MAPARPASPEEIDVWPENWPIWDAWIGLENRWRVVVAANGEVNRQGLDAAQIESTLRLMGMKRKERERVYQGLLVMEDAALAAIYGNGDT